MRSRLQGVVLFCYLIFLLFSANCKKVLSLWNFSDAVIYTYEDVELRRIFPTEFPLDTVRRTGMADPEHLGRYLELKSYYKHPTLKRNSHFEELACYEEKEGKVCKIDKERYSPEEEQFQMSETIDSHLDRRRVYCFMLVCFTVDEIDRVVASF